MRSDYYRPGPKLILPGLAPGGLVLRVYGVDTGALLSESRLTHDTNTEAEAQRAAAVTLAATVGLNANVVLVIYDGDTGRRWQPEDFARAGLPPPGSPA